MIIARLVGGLANQMFPYAAARRLAVVRNQPLKLDLSPFEYYQQTATAAYRTYSLHVFNIAASIATPDEIALTRRTHWRRWHRWANIFSVASDQRQFIYKEKKFAFDPTVMKLPGNVYLEGNWSSYRYFSEIEDIIRKDFTLKNPQSRECCHFVEQIRHHPSVSIHIRRGDFASNPKINQIYGTCELDYYRRCLEHLAAKVLSLHCFVFSDDPGWVRENFHIHHPFTMVEFNQPGLDHEQMWLMSQCQFNIIANSGFSWWAAWLNNHPQKLVYAPRQWFRAPSKYDTHTLIPRSWIQL